MITFLSYHFSYNTNRNINQRVALLKRARAKDDVIMKRAENLQKERKNTYSLTPLSEDFLKCQASAYRRKIPKFCYNYKNEEWVGGEGIKMVKNDVKFNT